VPVPGLPPILTLGHLAVCVLATSPAFFRFTSLPHTEGLAFTLLFASLLALDRAGRGHAVRWAAASGALAGLAYLARLSLASVPLAVIASLGFAALRGRGSWRAVAAAAGATALVCLPWWAFLASFVDPLRPAVLIHLGSHRATPALAPMEWMVPAGSWVGFLLDRASGLLVAFDPRHELSYARSFGASVYLVVLAALAAGPGIVRSRAPLRDAAQVTLHATVLGGTGALLLTHLAHQRIANEWLFHWRPGLPMILLIVPALGFLLSRGGAWRAVALALTVLTLVGAPARLAPELRWRNPAPSLQERALFAWIDAQQPVPTFLAAPARPLSVYTRGRFHDIYCHDAPEQVRIYFRQLPIDYLIVYPRKGDCRFLQGLDAELELVREFGRGRDAIRVYRPRPPAGVGAPS
jgi:4-amino-4-deoxy-L-arabinose transferase-like glycosyltransferase